MGPTRWVTDGMRTTINAANDKTRLVGLQELLLLREFPKTIVAVVSLTGFGLTSGLPSYVAWMEAARLVAQKLNQTEKSLVLYGR